MSAAHLAYRPSWAAADLAQIPAEFRAEIVRGALVVIPSPGKRHQRMIHQLMDQLDPQLPGGWTSTFDFDLIFSEDHPSAGSRGGARGQL